MSKSAHYTRYADLAPGRVKGWFRTQAGNHRATEASKRKRVPAKYQVRAAVRGMMMVVRVNIADKWTPSARLPARDVAARLPTIVLLEELLERVALPETSVLVDALLMGLPRRAESLRTGPHPLAADLAEIVTKFAERALVLRQGNSTKQEQ